jgi:hypothetical protein
MPHASDPTTDMSVNTTDHLIADMERLREHLRIEQWLLFGGSWGSTLILAYAERHPRRVSEIVIPGVTMTRPSEIDWLYRGVGRFFPEEWEEFRAGAPETERDGDLVAAYAQLLEDPDPVVRTKAAASWVAWEDAVISLEPSGKPKAYSSRPPEALLALVRRERVDVLAVQELTPQLAQAFEREGVGDLLPHTEVVPGSGLYSRLPLRPLPPFRGAKSAMAAAAVDVPGTVPVHAISVHVAVPLQGDDLRFWRADLRARCRRRRPTGRSSCWPANSTRRSTTASCAGWSAAATGTPPRPPAPASSRHGASAGARRR